MRSIGCTLPNNGRLCSPWHYAYRKCRIGFREPRGCHRNGLDSLVGIPPAWPFATSGWDIKDVRFVYDRNNDILYVGINFFGIAGDADGDGNPSVSAPALTAHGGTDVANLGQTEAVEILFDWNEDGVFDTIAGVPTDAAATAFSIAPDVSPGLTLPADSARFGTPVAGLEPFIGALNATAPDFEFKIPDVSTLPGFDAVSGFKFRAHAGSGQDDGIGEDFVENSGALHVDLPAPVPEPPAAPVVSLTELIVSGSHFNFWAPRSGKVGSREWNTRATKRDGQDSKGQRVQHPGGSTSGEMVTKAFAL